MNADTLGYDTELDQSRALLDQLVTTCIIINDYLIRTCLDVLKMLWLRQSDKYDEQIVIKISFLRPHYVDMVRATRIFLYKFQIRSISR